MNHINRIWFFRLGAIGLALLLLGAIEIALRLLQPAFLAGPRNEKLNPAGLPYFQITRQADAQEYQPTSYYVPWGHHFRFLMPKPLGVFRIFSVGDSTTNGSAFGNPGAYSHWLSIMLSALVLPVSYEVINCGQGGFPSSELMLLEKEVLGADPDLILFYLGNNEFSYHRLEKLTLRLPAWVLELKYRGQELELAHLIRFALDRFVRGRVDFAPEPQALRAHAAYFLKNANANTWDRTHLDQALAQFRSNLQQMVRMAKARGARVILCTVAVNLRDWEPYGSYHRADFPASAEPEWDRLVQEGKRAFARGDYAAARETFLRAADLDSTPADLNWDMGHCWLRLGQPEKAYAYFETAANREIFRDRAGGDTNAIIREVAAASGVPLADIAAEFRKRAPDGIPGNELFMDYVHPTLEGQQLIAATLLRTLVQQGWVRPGPGWEEQAQRSVQALEQTIPPDYLFRAYFTVASGNAFLGRFSRAKFWADQALQYSPHDPDGRQLRNALNQVLQQWPHDASVPWGEVEFAREYRPALSPP
jgi:tetratricopeptide (TPR) repeat protein